MPSISSSIRFRAAGARAIPIALASVLLALPGVAGATTITFDDLGLVHGEIVTGVPGVTIGADNLWRAFDYAVVFDSEASGTADYDLEARRGASRWSGGNLVGQELGLMLILQENATGCGDGVCDSPDDEGNRPAGFIKLDFDVPVSSFGFDLIDVDSLATENGYIVLEDRNQGRVQIAFATLLAGFEIGDNTANRIAPLLVEELGLGPVDHVTIKLYGSGAIDNISFVPVPEPATAILVGIGLALLSRRQRRA